MRFKLFDSHLCFVNSHLAAHFEYVQRRNQGSFVFLFPLLALSLVDYHDIAKRIIFFPGTPGVRRIWDHEFDREGECWCYLLFLAFSFGSAT